MIVGGVMVLRLRPAGRKFLMYTLLAVIVFEVVRTILTIYIQLQIMPVTELYMDRLLREGGGPGGNQSFAQFMSRIMKGAMIFGVIFALVWPLAKIILYGISSRYLASDAVTQLFEGEPPSGKGLPAGTP
jgi:hypothetical protein